MKTKKVTVVPYDPSWPGEFEKIRREVEEALGSLVLSVEHVGSTSVPGLAAKPIIDLDVVIGNETALEDVILVMACLGYAHEGDLGIPGREAFCYEGKEHLMKHHLYVCRESSSELKRHMAFRDHLRKHQEAMQEYGRIKLEAAALYPDSIDAYMAHKNDCIQNLYQIIGI